MGKRQVEKKHKEKMEALKASLPDIQKKTDDRGITINRVGVENVDFKLNILSKDGTHVPVAAKVNIFVSLNHVFKGVNMSRFVEALMEWKDMDVLSDEGIKKLLEDVQMRMKQRVVDSYIKIKFKYFMEKTAPVSLQKSVIAYDCWFVGILKNSRFQFQVGTEILMTSNCPCSREISTFGSHGQRSRCTVSLEPSGDKKFWLEDLIPLIESQGSCEIYPLLKRVDEKFVTERSYKNAKFVEDIGRDISKALQGCNRVKRFKIKVCNEESIHYHDAVAYIARKLRGNRWVSDDKSLRS